MHRFAAGVITESQPLYGILMERLSTCTFEWVAVKGQDDGTQALDTGRQRQSKRKGDLLGHGVDDKLVLSKR